MKSLTYSKVYAETVERTMLAPGGYMTKTKEKVFDVCCFLQSLGTLLSSSFLPFSRSTFE